MEICITSTEIPQAELKELLLYRLEATASDQISILPRPVRLRGPDSTVVVALVSASSAAVGALLTGLLQIAKERSSGRIILQANDGSRVEVGADTPSEKLDELVEKVRTMSQPRIHIGSPQTP